MSADNKVGKFFFLCTILLLFACSWTTPQSTPVSIEQSPKLEKDRKEPTATVMTDPASQVLEEIESLPEATAVPTPTEAPPPLEPISFSEENSSGDSSDDVFYSELLYLTQASINRPALCNVEEPTPHLSPVNEFAHGEEIKIQYETDIWSCWQQGEIVRVTITGPDGEIYQQEQIATADYNQYGLLTYQFKTDILQYPTGIYLISFEGESGIVDTKLIVVPTQETEIYWLEGGTIFFNNFQPEEQVQLFVYTPFPEINGVKLYAYAPFETNRDGQLIIKPSFKVPIVWIGTIGERSGLVEPEFTTSSFADMKALRNGISWPTSESGVEACHLLGETGLQSTEAGGELVTIAAELDFFDSFGNRITTLQAGNRVEVVFGVFWQEIRERPGEFGWHWSVILPRTGERGSLWDGYFAECQSVND